MENPKITGYFIKDIRQYGELSELIGQLKTYGNSDDADKMREEFLLELIKYYGK